MLNVARTISLKAKLSLSTARRLQITSTPGKTTLPTSKYCARQYYNSAKGGKCAGYMPQWYKDKADEIKKNREELPETIGVVDLFGSGFLTVNTKTFLEAIQSHHQGKPDQLIKIFNVNNIDMATGAAAQAPAGAKLEALQAREAIPRPRARPFAATAAIPTPPSPPPPPRRQHHRPYGPWSKKKVAMASDPEAGRGSVRW